MSIFRRFLTVGLLNTIVGYLFILLGLWLGLGDYVSNAVGYAVGFLISFNLHRRWTFNVKSTANWQQPIRYILSFITAYSMNMGVLYLVRSLGFVEHPIAQAIAMMAYTLTFYLLSRYVVFKNPKEAD